MSSLVSIPLEAYPADALGALSSGPATLGSARAAMWLAQLAYEEDTDKVRTVMARWGLSPLILFDEDDGTAMARTRGFMAQADGVTIVSFGGTDPLVLAHWITDLRVGKNAAGVHQGFAEALEVVWAPIAGALREPPHALLFTGHSMGGALALLCADRVRSELGVAPAAVFGFGMPRAGNAAFSKRINAAFGQRVYRFAHGRDLVPSVPPALLGYRHAGRYLACARHGRFDLAALSAAPSPEPGNGGGLAETFAAVLAHLRAAPAPDDGWQAQKAFTRLLPDPVADHLPDRYWTALEG